MWWIALFLAMHTCGQSETSFYKRFIKWCLRIAAGCCLPPHVSFLSEESWGCTEATGHFQILPGFENQLSSLQKSILLLPISWLLG